MTDQNTTLLLAEYERQIARLKDVLDELIYNHDELLKESLLHSQ